MTEQQVFDRVIEQLARQGGPSIDTDLDRCIYHRSDGRMCPGGVFISQDLIPQDYEGTPFNFLIGRVKSVRKEIPLDLTVNLIKELQDSHDESSRYGIEEARKSLIAVGKRYGLYTGKVGTITRWVK